MVIPAEMLRQLGSLGRETRGRLKRTSLIADFVARRISTVCLRVLFVPLLAAGCATGLAASQTARAADAFAPGQRVRVDADALNVRATPGLDGLIRKVLSSGAVLAIDGTPVSMDVSPQRRFRRWVGGQGFRQEDFVIDGISGA